MSLTYFVADEARNVFTRADAIAAGLGYAFIRGEGDPETMLCTAGPGGKRGFVLCFNPAARPGLVKYEPAEQTWIDAGGYWVGYWTAEKPSEEAFRREKMLAGEPVKLLDGATWTVPIARSMANGATLPQKLVLGEDKKTWLLADLPKYVELCGDAEKVAELFQGSAADGEHKLSIDYQVGMAICVKALTINYAVSAVEISLLELFTGDEMWAVLLALIDVPGVMRVQSAREKKRSASVTSPIGDGPGGNSPITSQPSVT